VGGTERYGGFQWRALKDMEEAEGKCDFSKKKKRVVTGKCDLLF
jgi:hypothetical protein